MRNILFLLTLIGLCCCETALCQTTDAAGIVYVKKGSNGNGNSWANATGELADALKAAKYNTQIKYIYISAGTYNPLYSPEDTAFGKDKGRLNAFLLVKNVKLYGGFSATAPETDTAVWLIQTNKTILSGNIGINGDDHDNCYRIIASCGDVGNALMDGMTIANNFVSDGDLTSSILLL